MNIADILGGIKKDGSSDLVTKIQIKSETSKIEKRADEFADQVMNWICDEAKYINNGMSFGGPLPCPGKVCLSDEDKKMLMDKLVAAAKEIPGKISKMISEITGDIKDEEKKEETEEKTEETPEKKVEIEITKTGVPPVPPVEVAKPFVPGMFGY